MKKIPFILILFLSGQLFAQTQLANGGFEQWEGSGDNLRPKGWNTAHTATGGYAWAAAKGQAEPSSDHRPGSSGSKSVRVFARTILGIVANGNITTGRVNMGSMKLSSTSNNNSTRTKEEGFFHRFSAMPDSLTVWVKSEVPDNQQNAYVHAMIHDRFDYSEPPTPEAAPHLVGDALIYIKTGGWRRMSVPFTYSTNKNPEYILMTIGTNRIPGKGSKNDVIFLDDFLMVYNPQLSLSPLHKNKFRRGEMVEIAYRITGTMSPENLNAEPNQLFVELSDKNGNFEKITTLGNVTTNISGSITVAIPTQIDAGNRYRIRLRTTNYPMISEDNGTDIVID